MTDTLNTTTTPTIPTTNTPVATLYGKPGCVQCASMARHLKNKKITYTYLDITEDEAAYEWVQSMGYQAVPVTVIGFQHFYGFDPDQVERAIQAL